MRTKQTYSKLARAAMMLLVALFATTASWAQDGVITVGSSSRATGYLPCYPNNTYSMSQQIYTSEEIGQSGLITSIAFYNYDTGSARTCDIYLSHTAKTSFDNSTDWVTVSEENKVFSGTITLGSDWTVIDFDTPFLYDGTQNLLLTVDDNTGKDTGSNFSIGAYDASDQALYYYKMFGNPVNLDPTQAITEEGTVYYRKNCIKLCFETLPKPYQVEAVEVGNVSAQIQCTLRGDAIAWNLRYRKVAGEGEQEQRWVTEMNLGRSFTIEDLTPATQYEVQVQAVFEGEELSGWTDPLTFTTFCCPVEGQAEVIYALNSDYRNWYGYAVQIIDITDEANPVEVALLRAPSYQMYGGTLTLCCEHKYKVNWIYDEKNPDFNRYYSFALYFEPGDLVYSMNMGYAPEETAELTTFIMDCTSYCAPKPTNISVAGTTFNSATISFTSETKGGEVVYSTSADFDPEEVTPTRVSFVEIPANPDSWEPNPANSSLTLTGLEPLTEYYVRLRSVCDGGGISRWSDPIKVTTGSRYDAPSQVIAKAVTSRIEDLSWGGNGNEKGYNLYYRKQGTGTPVNLDDVQTFGGGNGTGFEYGNWGEKIWNSYGSVPFSNTLFVGNVPAGSSFSFMAGNGKTGAGAANFLYGMMKKDSQLTPLEQMKKFDLKCLDDDGRAARINDLESDIQICKDAKEGAKKELESGNFTQAQYDEEIERLDKQIANDESALAELQTLPTDAEKLARMKELEQAISKKEGSPEEIASMQRELSELRALTSEAANGLKSMFSILMKMTKMLPKSPHRAPEDDTYIFFIRHADPNGVLLVTDLTITPPEQLGEWIVIKNIASTEYTLTGLEPGTAYEVMVEPVYEDGTTGTCSPITVFTTLGEETEPVMADFSVSESKKVNFAHGNLRCKGDRYEAEWSMAKQQYEVLGQDNIDVDGSRSYPAWLVDLFCWSTLENYYGVSSYYYYDDDEARSFFNGEFADWGECPTLIRDLGEGWQTLSKDEWNYLLNERPNATQLRTIATVAGVKGLVLIPDEWNAPDGIMLSEEMTAEQWAVIEQTGLVFLPAAGQMTSTYVDYVTTTTVTEAATYWTSTPSGDKSDMNAFVLSIDDAGATVETDLMRRVMTAVRLVKDVDNSPVTTIKQVTTASLRPSEGIWYMLDGRKLSSKPTQRGIYIINGKKYMVR